MKRTAALRTSGTLISTVLPVYVVMSQHQWTVTTELSFSCQISRPKYLSAEILPAEYGADNLHCSWV